jgi:GNAT superfamily N-acetyltransferase
MGGFGQPTLLVAGHDVAGFDCGSVALSEWLVRHALTAQGAGSSRVYVTTDFDSERVVGYYALAAGSIAWDASPPRVVKGLGRYPVPVVVLTRLAVDRTRHGKGLGRALLTDALRRIEQAADEIGVGAVLIHAESESAKAFYLNYAGFEASPTDPMHLLLLMKDLRRALGR